MVVETSSSSVCSSNIKHYIFWQKDSKSLIKQKWDTFKKSGKQQEPAFIQ